MRTIREKRVHDWDRGGDLRPKVVNEGIEIGQRVYLQSGVALVQHRQ